MRTTKEVDDIWLAVLRSRLPAIVKVAEGLQVTVDGRVFSIPEQSKLTGTRMLRSR